jgi:hypothetical protein
LTVQSDRQLLAEGAVAGGDGRPVVPFGRPVDDRKPVMIYVRGDGSTHVKGIARCGQVGLCPRCAPKVRGLRAADISHAVENWLGRGEEVWFATFTVPHREWESAGRVWDRVQGRYSWAFSDGRAGQDARRSNGVVHSIRAVEVTYGANGWHVHIHALLFCRSDVGRFDPVSVAHRWRDALQSEGLRYVPHVSCDLRPVTASDVGDYLAKVDGSHWGAGVELARCDLKASRGLRVDQVLELATTGEAEWVRRWAQLERQTRGRRWFRWSAGLRAEVGLTDPEMTDEEAAASSDGVAPVAVFVCPWRVWEQWRHAGRLGELRQLCVRCEAEVHGLWLIRVAWGPPDRVERTPIAAAA